MPKFKSRSLAILLILAAVLFVLTALMHFADSGSGLASNRLREAHFRQCVRFIDFFQSQHNRLPTPKEFEQWSHNQLPGVPDTLDGYSGQTMIYETDSFSVRIIDRFGPPAPGSYTLDDWTGDGDAYYASWAKRSSLALPPDDYYILGNPTAGSLALLFIALLLGTGAWQLWPKRPI